MFNQQVSAKSITKTKTLPFAQASGKFVLNLETARVSTHFVKEADHCVIRVKRR